MLQEMAFLQDVEVRPALCLPLPLHSPCLPARTRPGLARLLGAGSHLPPTCSSHRPQHNDGRLMLFQLPSLLPVAAGAGAGDGAGPSVAASRPASLREVPTSRIGKLLVFESGRVKLQV